MGDTSENYYGIPIVRDPYLPPGTVIMYVPDMTPVCCLTCHNETTIEGIGASGCDLYCEFRFEIAEKLWGSFFKGWNK